MRTKPLAKALYQKSLVLILFVATILCVTILTDVIPSVPQVQPVAAQPWVPLPKTSMNITGGTASQSWIFRVGWPPGPFKLDIQVGGVTNLFAWEFKLRWNASILNFGSVTEGDFLKSGGSTVFYNQTFQDEVGWDYILVNCTLQSGSGVSGSGRIATVSFVVQDSGKTPLDLYETRLVDSSQAIIKHGVTDGCVLSGDSAIIYPLLYVVPQTSVADPNEMFNVTVGLDQVENLYTYDITIKWYPPPLLLVNLSPNVTDLKWLYSPLGYGFTWTKNEAEGTVSVAASRTGNQDGKTGSGLLTTITFQVSPYYTGKTFLNFTDTILIGIDRSDPDYPFLYPIDHETFGGFFHTEKLEIGPRALFTYSPINPIVGETITFDASESYDFDGEIVSYFWDFDDGTSKTTSGAFTAHAYTHDGMYYVSLTVTDNEGFQDTITHIVTVVAPTRPTIYVHPDVTSAKPGETFSIAVKISDAKDVFGWEVHLGWNASILNFVSVKEGDFLKGPEQASTYFINKTYQDEIDIDCIAVACTRLGYIPGASGSGTLATITFLVERKGETVLDLFDTKLRDSRPTPYPIEHTSTDGFFVAISVPEISISPASGPVGTKVTVRGHSFPAKAGGILTFDDQLLGLIYIDDYGNFAASFSVPFSEVGPHTVKVSFYDYPSPIAVEATFTVIDVTPIDVNIDVGDIFFERETVEFYVQTALKGRPIDVKLVNVTLYKPTGSNQTLTYQRIAIGLYKIRYTIGEIGFITGTYTLIVEASHTTETIATYGTAIKTFIVKPAWEREVPKIAAFSIASVGLISAAIWLWRKEEKKFL